MNQWTDFCLDFEIPTYHWPGERFALLYHSLVTVTS